MPRKIILTFFFTALLVLVGAGCAPQTPAPQPISTSTAPVVIKKPPSAENKNSTANFCEKNNNEVIIRFDQTAQKSQFYCRFADTTECTVESYQEGKCGPGKGSKIYQPEKPSLATAAETCSNESQPVCGAGNITFTNACVAKMQGANVVHSGACAIASAPETAEEQIPANLNVSHAGQPDWLAVATSFILSQPQQNPRAHLDRCSFNGRNVYLLSAGCVDCVDVLYEENGKVLCYPRNDFSGACANFSAAASTCSRVWTDKR